MTEFQWPNSDTLSYTWSEIGTYTAKGLKHDVFKINRYKGLIIVSYIVFSIIVVGNYVGYYAFDMQIFNIPYKLLFLFRLFVYNTVQ